MLLLLLTKANNHLEKKRGGGLGGTFLSQVSLLFCLMLGGTLCLESESAGLSFVVGSRFWVWLLGGAAGKLMSELPQAGSDTTRDIERGRERRTRIRCDQIFISVVASWTALGSGYSLV